MKLNEFGFEIAEDIIQQKSSLQIWIAVVDNDFSPVRSKKLLRTPCFAQIFLKHLRIRDIVAVRKLSEKHESLGRDCH